MKTLPVLKSIKEISLLEEMGAVITFEPMEEDISPDDMYIDEEDAKHIRDQYNNGNMAAWFCAKVTVSYKGIEEYDTLGCCSYKSFKEFTTMDKDYYMDMINTCIDSINKEIEFTNTQTVKQWTIRKAKQLIQPYGLFIVSNKELQTL